MDADKEKALDYLHHSAPIAEALSSPRLISAAKIAEDFENPKLPDENLKKILRKGFTSLTPHKQP